MDAVFFIYILRRNKYHESNSLFEEKTIIAGKKALKNYFVEICIDKTLELLI